MEVHLIRSFAHFKRAGGPPNLSSRVFSSRILTISSKPMQPANPQLGKVIGLIIEQNTYQPHGLNITSAISMTAQEMMCARVRITKEARGWHMLWQTCYGNSILATVELKTDRFMKFIVHEKVPDGPVYPDSDERAKVIVQIKDLLEECLRRLGKTMDSIETATVTTNSFREFAILDLPEVEGSKQYRYYLSRAHMGTRLIGAVFDSNPRFLNQVETHRVGSMWMPLQDLLTNLRNLAENIFKLPGMSTPVSDPDFVALFPRVATKFFQLRFIVRVLFTEELEDCWRQEIAVFMSRPRCKRGSNKKKNRGTEILLTSFLFWTQLVENMRAVDETDRCSFGIYDTLAHLERCNLSDTFVARMKGHLARVITSFTQFNFNARSRELLQQSKGYQIPKPENRDFGNWDLPNLRTLVCSKGKHVLSPQLWLTKRNCLQLHPQPFDTSDCILGEFKVCMPSGFNQEDIINISRVTNSNAVLEIRYARSIEIQGWARLQLASSNMQRPTDRCSLYLVEAGMFGSSLSRTSKLSLKQSAGVVDQESKPQLDRDLVFETKELVDQTLVCQSFYRNSILRICSEGDKRALVISKHLCGRNADKVEEETLVSSAYLTTDLTYEPEIPAEWKLTKVNLQVHGMAHNSVSGLFLIKDNSYPPSYQLLSLEHDKLDRRQEQQHTGRSSRLTAGWAYGNKYVVCRGRTGLLCCLVMSAHLGTVDLLELVVLHRRRHLTLLKEQRPLFKSPLPASFSAGQHVVQFDARHLRLLFWWSEKRWVPFREGEDRAGSPEDGRFEFFAHVKVAKFLF